MPVIKTNKREQLVNEFAAIELDISEKIDNLNPEDLFLPDGDLPALSETKIDSLDYNSQITEIQNDAEQIINNLAELYIGDEQLLTHPYIKEKRRKDANYYGRIEFLVQTSQKTLISIMREIDSGQTETKMFELQSMIQKEMRENIKLSLHSLADIEKFYKSIRKDLGMSTPPAVKIENEESNTHIDMKEFNDQLEQMMKDGNGKFIIDDDND